MISTDLLQMTKTRNTIRFCGYRYKTECKLKHMSLLDAQRKAKHYTELQNWSRLVQEVYCVLIPFFIFPSAKHRFYFAAFKNKILEVTMFFNF